MLISVIIMPVMLRGKKSQYQQSMDMSNYNPCKTRVDLITASQVVDIQSSMGTCGIWTSSRDTKTRTEHPIIQK